MVEGRPAGTADEEIEEFDLVEYMRENGWDAGKVCQLTDHGAQRVIAMWMVEAIRAIEGQRYKRAKENADQALKILKDEFEAGRTKQAEREAARDAEALLETVEKGFGG